MVERCFWDALSALRRVLERDPETARLFANRIQKSKRAAGRRKPGSPRERALGRRPLFSGGRSPRCRASSSCTPGGETTLRGQLGKALGFLNKFSGGSIFVSAADLLGSTSINEGAKGFAPGFYSFAQEPRLAGRCPSAASAKTP